MLTKVYVVTSCKLGTVPINNTLSCYLYCITSRLTIAPIIAFCCTVAVTHSSRLMTITTTQIFPIQLPNSDPSSYQMTHNCNLSAACPSSPWYCIRLLWNSAPFHLTSILHFAWMGSCRFLIYLPLHHFHPYLKCWNHSSGRASFIQRPLELTCCLGCRACSARNDISGQSMPPHQSKT